MESEARTIIHGTDRRGWPNKMEHAMVLTADYDQHKVDHGVHGLTPEYG